MRVVEDPRYSKEYHDPDKRSIANAVQVFFRDGTSTEKVEVEYPIGHRRRRAEGIPVLEAKFLSALKTRFPKGQAQRIYDLCQDEARLMATPVNRFTDLFVI
jgi:2-methylcitrate dehydratase